MINKRFDPRKFIDREFEQELFADLLLLKNDARILAIRDKSGMGKSHLLKIFQYRCRTNRPDRIPISLVELDQLPDNSPLALIKLIVQHLATFDIACPKFTHNNSMRLSADFLSISKSPYLRPSTTGRKQSAREHVNVAALRFNLITHFNESELRDVYFDLSIEYESLPGQHKNDKARELISYAQRNRRIDELVTHCRRLQPQADWQAVERLPTPEISAAELFDDAQSWDDELLTTRHNPPVEPLTPEQEATAQEVSIRAFFDDLSAICADRTIVLMFDAYEKCNDKLKQWIEEYFLERLFFNREQRPQRLLLVVSGREVPDFDARWSIDDCDTLIRSVKELGKWGRSDVADCLRVHGYDDYDDQKVDTFYNLILMGIPPSGVVDMIQLAVANRRSAS
jgi:hypothetical protein